MFDYSKTELAAKAVELNFTRDTLEKVFRLADVLSYFNSNPLTKTTLALKGGTAINMMVFNLPRLSVDIDLDYCINNTREQMLNQRDYISEDIKLFMTTQGYSLSPRSKSHHSLDSFVFTYNNLGNMNDNIKIEINYSLRSHIFEPVERELSAVVNIKKGVYSLHPMEIFASKINALLSRVAVRDLYDTYNMVRFGLFDETELSLLRKCVIFYTAISQEEIFSEYSIVCIDAITLRKIKTDLLPVIRKSEFIDLGKIKTEVKLFLEQLLVLTEQEKDFLRLFSEKQYIPELLFDDENIITRIREHPMVLWKMQNR